MHAIKDGALIEDSWLQLDTFDASLSGDLLLPLDIWQSQAADLATYQGGQLGLTLDVNDDWQSLDLTQILCINIHFESFVDGRGYSVARLLRERAGYTGVLRASGDVLVDQVYYLQRCGFNQLALRADQNPEAALAALASFDVRYQPAADEHLPLFKRR